MIDEKYTEQTPKYVEQTPKKKMGKVKKILLIVAGSFLLLVILGMFVSAITPAPKQDATPQQTTTTQVTPAPKQATPQPSTPAPQDTAKRDVTGKYTTLGAGTFQGGKDVVSGTYDVTAPGQTGNFMVSGTDTYNEIFGQGVTKVRATIADGDKIELSGLDNVIFTPVTSDYITSHSKVTLYAGTFVV